MDQGSFFTITEGSTKANSLTTSKTAQDMKNSLMDLNIKAISSKESNKEKDSSNGQTAKFMKESLTMALSMALEFGLLVINKVTLANGHTAKLKVLGYILISMEIAMKANLKTPKNQVRALNVSIMVKHTLDSIAKIVPTVLDNTFGQMAATIKANL